MLETTVYKRMDDIDNSLIMYFFQRKQIINALLSLTTV